jgi:hypothetical protein
VPVTIPGAYIRSSKMTCVSLGLAATTPTDKFIAFGPLVNGNLANAKSILSGFGFNFGAQASSLVGYQLNTNSSGSVGVQP